MISDQDILDARILIVDDNSANVDLLEKTLADAGYVSVLGITDPCETVKLYESYQPDIIVLDINMPQMNGYQVMAELEKIKHDNYMPILVLTAQHDRETLFRSLQSGAKDFLTKPFNLTEILMRIRNMLEVRLLHEQVRNQNTDLEQKVKERTLELHDTRLEVIRRLGLAAEYRDNETGYHIIRMSKMCQAIGDAIGLPVEKSELILQASPMHDIGKIGIPDHILLKPDKLDPEEWITMKTHTTIGGNMLGLPTSDLMYMAKEIAISHHEKWDGSGYPHGWKQEKIPLVGRVAALADVFDALTSIRPYKQAWSVDDTVAEINRNRGRHFDPQLVDALPAVLDELVSIKAQYKEPEE